MSSIIRLTRDQPGAAHELLLQTPRDSIRWHYRCFDRILLNGLIQPFQQPERVVGFFNTHRQLYPVSRHTLRDIAEQFQRWLKGWSEKRNIPVAELRKAAATTSSRPISEEQTRTKSWSSSKRANQRAS